MTTPIQTQTPLTLTGQIDQVTLIDSGAQPNVVISVADPFRVDVQWSLAGTMLPFLGGDFVVRAFVESMGRGYEGQVGPTQTVPVTSATAYSASIVVPGGTLLPAPGEDDTVYKLVVLVSHRNHGVKTQLAGFEESVYFEIQVP